MDPCQVMGWISGCMYRTRQPLRCMQALTLRRLALPLFGQTVIDARSSDDKATRLKGSKGPGILLAGFAGFAAAAASSSPSTALTRSKHPIVKYNDIDFGQTEVDLDVRGTVTVSPRRLHPWCERSKLRVHPKGVHGWE